MRCGRDGVEVVCMQEEERRDGRVVERGMVRNVEVRGMWRPSRFLHKSTRRCGSLTI